MKTYEAIAKTAHIDWADSSKEVSLGFFSSKEKAEKKIREVFNEKESYMRYDSFFIRKHEVR